MKERVWGEINQTLEKRHSLEFVLAMPFFCKKANSICKKANSICESAKSMINYGQIVEVVRNYRRIAEIVINYG